MKINLGILSLEIQIPLEFSKIVILRSQRKLRVD